METIKEIVSSLSDWLKNRVVNPWFGCFIASWFAINWRLVLALASDDSYAEKIAWIDTQLYPASWHLPFYGIIQPALWAVLWVIASPICFRKLITYYRTEQGKTRDQIMVLDKARLVPREEAEIYLMQRTRAVTALQTFKEQSDAREAGLLERINTLESELNTLTQNQATATLNDEDRQTGLGNFKFSARELFGAEQYVIQMLLTRGIEQDEAAVLMSISGLEEPNRESLEALYRTSGTSIPVVLMRLEKLGLIEFGTSHILVTKSGYVVMDRLRKSLETNLKNKISLPEISL